MLKLGAWTQGFTGEAEAGIPRPCVLPLPTFYGVDDEALASLRSKSIHGSYLKKVITGDVVVENTAEMRKQE